MSHEKRQQNFEAFTNELEQLSRKYGIVLQATGGVYDFDSPEGLEAKGFDGYTKDVTSGDLIPIIRF